MPSLSASSVVERQAMILAYLRNICLLKCVRSLQRSWMLKKRGTSHKPPRQLRDTSPSWSSSCRRCCGYCLTSMHVILCSHAMADNVVMSVNAEILIYLVIGWQRKNNTVKCTRHGHAARETRTTLNQNWPYNIIGIQHTTSSDGGARDGTIGLTFGLHLVGLSAAWREIHGNPLHLAPISRPPS